MNISGNENSFSLFRKVIIVVTIVRFSRKENFPGLSSVRWSTCCPKLVNATVSNMGYADNTMLRSRAVVKLLSI